MNFNKVILGGRLTADPELRNLPNSGKAVCEFNLANNRKFGEKEETLFIRVVFFDKRAEVVASHFKKGDQILVEGRLKLEEWEGKEGQKNKTFKVIGDQFEFVGGKKHDGQGQAQGGERPSYAPKPQAERASTTNAGTAASPGAMGIADEDIPF